LTGNRKAGQWAPPWQDMKLNNKQLLLYREASGANLV